MRYNPDIIGVGGVFTLDDALELLSVGAKAVGIASLIIESGFEAIPKLRASLSLYLQRKGLKLEDIIGRAVKR
jgi:dihydroorotate dehydrogenase (fumarate)